jgi:5-methylcytosine-specific restriction endonuclease McrA
MSRLRLKVFDRDRAVCAACGADTAALEVQMRREARAMAHNGPYFSGYDLAFTVTGIQLRREGYLIRQSLWECDHVVPSTDGGVDALDNLQTLCQPCHRNKTARENSTRARA